MKYIDITLTIFYCDA